MGSGARERDDRADVIEQGADRELSQRAGTLAGQGDAVDTGESAGIIDEVGEATAGRRVDTPDEAAGTTLRGPARRPEDEGQRG
jgi:hypothetical protein